MAACVGFQALLPSDQGNITPGNFVILTMNTIVFDEGGFYSAATFGWTPPAGLIAIRGCCSLSVIAA